MSRNSQSTRAPIADRQQLDNSSAQHLEATTRSTQSRDNVVDPSTMVVSDFERDASGGSIPQPQLTALQDDAVLRHKTNSDQPFSIANLPSFSTRRQDVLKLPGLAGLTSSTGQHPTSRTASSTAHNAAAHDEQDVLNSTGQQFHEHSRFRSSTEFKNDRALQRQSLSNPLHRSARS